MSARRTVTPPGTPSQYVDPAGYMRAFRQARPEKYRRGVMSTAARISAALRVAKRYPDEFDAAIREERAKRGLS